MAYIPPHKRHSKILEKSSPTPELLVPRFKRDIKLNPAKPNIERSGKIIYANNAISRWFMVGSTEADQFPASVHLEPVSLEAFEQRTGGKPLALINSHLMKEESNDPRGIILRPPWASISGKVLQDLLSTFKIVKNEMDFDELEVIKPTLVARFGKVLFHGSPSVSLENIKEIEAAEATLGQLKRTFYTSVSTSYMENIVDVVVPEIGVDFEDEKDIYHVKLSDRTRKDATISCKCSVTNDKRLELYKVELNQIRNMVIDVSCLEKNMDLRLMLCTKRILTSLIDDEMHSIRDLINSAVLDTDVKGGLRWPLGKASSGDRYSVVGVWHTISKAYKSPSLRLKVRSADRYDFQTSRGESTNEIVLKLKGILSELQEDKLQGSVSLTLEDTLKLIWDHFLSDEHSPLP
ncbi:uncharacterized protein LOC120017173 [Tripterygium wilfordii]|uniref:uncharacterized protein LOC120017173 n=1 Tax=Tripterygium wilfordii TaxID=458696 RepID=UPI0018F83A2E|nr:uncharacterized protein LOC120017173 [Tripterygium wilfordii]XP_038726229.1 uncharacterized protein LOC120017173 [Tripterygium wilfordii]XP_038726230.1 uncharacterized protein LOC120017173 [Tripterygium wilfordii]